MVSIADDSISGGIFNKMSNVHIADSLVSSSSILLIKLQHRHHYSAPNAASNIKYHIKKNELSRI